MSTRRRARFRSLASAFLFAVIAAVVGLFDIPHLTRVEAATIDVLMNLSDVRQSIDGFGASDAWNDNATPLFSDSEMDLFFSPQNGIGLSFLRLAIQPNGSNSTSLSIAQRAAARGARVWAAPWSAPASWKDNASTTYGGHLCAYAGQGACTAEHYSDWAVRLAAFATNLKASGVDLYGISVQNEPDFTASYDSMLFTDQEMVDFIKNLGPRLAALSPRPKLVVGDYANWNNIWNLRYAIQADPVAASYTDIYAVHQYFGTSYYQNQLSRPLWQTEMSGFDSFDPGIDNAINVAEWINDALVNGNVNSWHYWWLRGLNEDNEGLVGHASDAYAMTKRLYAMGNYSRFIRPGWVRLGTSGNAANMTTLAFRNPSTNEVAFIVVNHGGTATATFGVSGTFQSSITPFQTYDDGSGNYSIGSHGNLEQRPAIGAAGSNAFTATVPHGITTFVGTASAGQTVSAPGAFSKSSPAYGASGLGTSLTLTWGTASGAAGYEYCIDTTNDNACSNWTSVGSATSAFVSGLASGTSYYWQVRASNAGGTTYSDGSSFNFSMFSTATGAPGSFNKSAPTNGATGQSTGLTLSWGASSGATNYEYCIDATNDGVCAAWTSVGGSTSAFVSGLAQGTTYYWHVRASNAGGTTYAVGGSGAFWSFTTFTSAPGAFSKSSPAYGASGLGTSLTLTWGTASGATNYEYCIDTTNDNACSTWTSVGSATSAFVSGLASGTSYYWQVRASNAGGTTYGDGSSFNFSMFSTATGAPGSFNKSAPANGATGQSTGLTLSWGASSGATNYEYCIDATNDGVCAAWTSVGGSTSAFVSGLAQGTTYYWHVRASNAGGTTYAVGGSGAFWSFTTFTSAPGAFSKQLPGNGATGQSTSLTLTWDGASGAATYEYCIDATNDGACSGWVSTGSATSVFLSGLAGGTSYFWQVRASNAGGATYADGGASVYATFTTQFGAPGAFSKLAPAYGASGQSTSLTLTWGTASGASGYEYCIDTTNDNACSGWTSVGSATSAFVSGLASGTSYFWQVRASNAGGTTYGDGSSFNFSMFSTATGAPGSFNKSLPANGATGQSTSPTLSWGAASGATGYEYCIDATNDGVCAAWTSVGGSTSAFVSGLAQGTTYYWHVRASNAGGTTYAVGGSGAFWSFTTQAGAPGAFNKVAPLQDSGGQSTTPLLTWTPSSGAATYEYCIDRFGACSTWISAGAATSASVTGLQTGTTYYWTVRAVNAGGTTYANGNASFVWSFTTQVSAPGAFSKSQPANGSSGQPTFLTLSWNNASGANAYEYCLSTAGLGDCTSWTYTGGATSVNVGGLDLGATYTWQVRALNGDGTTYANDASSAAWTFTTQVLQPSVITTGASGITLTGATLNGIVNPGGQVTATAFEYGPTTGYGALGAGPTLSGTSDQPISASVALACGTSYHYRARATNSSGVQYGADQIVVMPPCAPSVTTGSATRGSTPDTTLSGTVNPMGGATSAWFDYGTTAGYGSSVGVSSNPGSGTSPVNVSATLSGLACGTTYHFRLVAANSSGTVAGADSTFTACDGATSHGSVRGDVDGDGKADASIYRPATGEWLLLKSSDGSSSSYPWGLPGDVPEPGDYDGDGRMDLAIYRPATGGWWIAWSRSAYQTYNGFEWGVAGDVPVPADYDGDGTTDLAVYRPATGGWWILTSRSGFRSDISYAWGLPEDLPVPADYDGDGKTDPAVYRPSTGDWWILKSSTGYIAYSGLPWGLPGDVPQPGDYDGDGKADLAVFRPSTGVWWVTFSSTNFTTYAGYPWGYGTDVPVPADYDGDGKTDIAVFRPTTGEWWVLTSSSHFLTHMRLVLGGVADTPLTLVSPSFAP